MHDKDAVRDLLEQYQHLLDPFYPLHHSSAQLSFPYEKSKHVVELTATSDPASTVGGYFPLTVNIASSSYAFPSSGQIVLSAITPAQTASDCSGILNINAKISAYSCSYSSGVLTITATQLMGSSSVSSLVAGAEIAITIASVLYNTSPATQSLTATMADSSGCTVEQSTNSSCWGPQNPAAISDAVLSVYSDSSGVSQVGGTSTVFKLTFTPIVAVTTNNLIYIAFDSGITSGTAIPDCSGFQAASDLTAGSVAKGSCTGYSSSDDYTCPTAGVNSMFIISPFILPSTTKPFKATITFYLIAGSTTIVQTGISNAISAVKATVSTVGTVKLYSGATSAVVGDTNVYSIDITPPCSMAATSVFTVGIPANFNATAPCAGDTNCKLIDSIDFNLSNAISSVCAAGTTVTIKFSLTNPATTCWSTKASSVSVSDSGYPSFSLSATLLSTITFTAGTISTLSVIPTSATAGATTVYTVTINTAHAVPKGYSIVLTFSSAIDISGMTLASAKVDGTVAASAALSSSSKLTIENAFSGSGTAGSTTIVIIYGGVKNPDYLDTFAGFGAVISSGTCVSDVCVACAQIEITDLPLVNVTCLIGNDVNSATNVGYTFTISTSDPASYAFSQTSTYIMSLQIPSSDIASCDPSSLSGVTNVAMTVSSSSNPTYNFSLSFTATTTSFAFQILCANPGSTKPTGAITLIFTTTAGKQVYKGTVASVHTAKGRAMSASSVVSNTPHYPFYPTASAFTLARTEATIPQPIYKVEVGVYSPSANSTSACQVDYISGYTCTLSSVPGATVGNLTIAFSLGSSQTSFSISGVPSVNPNKTTDTMGPFTAKTYTKSGLDYYLVDQSDDIGSLTVTCDYPCRTCQGGNPANCTACAEESVAKVLYYLLSDGNGCIVSGAGCGSGYYNYTSDTEKTCIKCTGNCSECEGEPTNCTRCKDSTLYLLSGECRESCPASYFVSTSSGYRTCQKCNTSCASCSGNENNCTSCAYPLYLTSVNTCVEAKYCGTGFFANSTGQTCDACASTCYTCSDSSDKCTECSGTLYLKGRACISKAECVSGNLYFANLTAHACSPCDYTACAQCEDSAKKCTACSGSTGLYGNECVWPCPEGTYLSANVCSSCANTCKTCSSSDTCIVCSGNNLFEDDTSQCVAACDYQHYLYGSYCIRCNSSCYSCAQSSTACTACVSGRYLYSRKCIDSCPSGTYADEGVCTTCNDTCATCSVQSDNCTSCYGSGLLEGNACVSACSAGKVNNGSAGVCVSCESECATCSGTTDYCVTCHNDTKYAYGGACLDACPAKTLASATEQKCVACNTGCLTCSWSTTSTKMCVKCEKYNGYNYVLSGTCVSICPTDYYVSSDNNSCVAKGQNDPTVVNSTSSSDSSAKILFPHMLCGVVMVAVAAAGVIKDYRSHLWSNIAVLLSPVWLCNVVLQGIFSFFDGEYILLLVTAGAVALAEILNIVYLMVHICKISRDRAYVAWRTESRCASWFLNVMNAVVSFHWSRLFFSRILGLSTFLVPFEDVRTLLIPLGYVSLAAAVLAYIPVIVVDIYYLRLLSWGQLYIFVIESLVFSCIMAALTCYELRLVNKSPAEIFGEDGYDKLRTGAEINSEALRQRIVEDVFDKLGLLNRRSARLPIDMCPDKSAIRRRRSDPGLPSLDREQDPRQNGSYPSSPRVEREKAVPLKKYGADDGHPYEEEVQADNVYSEAAPAKDHFAVGKAAAVDFSVQTPPFRKLEAFQQFLKEQDERKRRKQRRLFDYGPEGNPLEVVSEEPLGAEGDEKRQNDPPTRISPPPEEAEEGKGKLNECEKTEMLLLDHRAQSPAVSETTIKPSSVSGLGDDLVSAGNADCSNNVLRERNIHSPPQGNTLADAAEALSFPLELDPAAVLVTTKKTPKKPATPPPQPESRATMIDDAEIMGSFERDPEDKSILIHESQSGELVDMRGRKVNRLGYLVDKDGNIVNRAGEIMIHREELDKEFDDHSLAATQKIAAGTKTPASREEDLPKLMDNFIKELDSKCLPSSQTPQYTAPPPEFTPVSTVAPPESRPQPEPEPESKKMGTMHRAGSRESVHIDPRMEDTPSNYNLQNQRFDDPRDSVNKPLPKSQTAKEEAKKDLGESKAADRRGNSRLRLQRRARAHHKKNRNQQELLRRASNRVSGYDSDRPDPIQYENPHGQSEITLSRQPPSHPDASSALSFRPGEPAALSSGFDRHRLGPRRKRRGAGAHKVFRFPIRRFNRDTTQRNTLLGESSANPLIQKIYDDQSLYADFDSEKLFASAAPGSGHMATMEDGGSPSGLRALETIYLQRLESGAHAQEKKRMKPRDNEEAKRNGEDEGKREERDSDEISEILADNYKEMESQFSRIKAPDKKSFDSLSPAGTDEKKEDERPKQPEQKR